MLVDPNDPDDVTEVHRIQDGLRLITRAARPFEMPDYDHADLDTTRGALLALAGQMQAFGRSFGRKTEVDPIYHLIATGAGWGGLPDTEAVYVSFNRQLPAGRYELHVGEVLVDGFWSISVYNAAGYFEPNAAGVYNVNSVTGIRDADGSITVRFGEHDGAPNTIPISEGWNHLVRLYRPWTEIPHARGDVSALESATVRHSPATELDVVRSFAAELVSVGQGRSRVTQYAVSPSQLSYPR